MIKSHYTTYGENAMKKFCYLNILDMTYTIAECGGAITDIRLGREILPDATEEYTDLIRQAEKELKEYFDRKRTTPLSPEGTDFQKAVWNETMKVPYSKTTTYGHIAANIGNPDAARAVGNALNKNPIMIMIPCHRVLSAARDKLGFACGPDMKKYLLSVEGSEFLCNIKN